MSDEKYGFCRIRKYNEGAVTGIEQHMERRATISNTNPDIKRGKSKNNYDLMENFDRTFKSLIKERLKKTNVKISKKDPRNVVMAEILFSASPEFFENLSPDEIRQYFQNCLDFAKKKYGEENIISAIVHLDETSPHMHLMFVPVTKDNRLCARDIFNGKRALKQLQDEAHEQVFSKYGLTRGKERNAKHVETLDWKIDQRIMKLNELEKEYTELEQKLNSNEFYKLEKYAKEIKKRLFETYEVIESDPKLLEQYKTSLEKFERFKSQNKEQDEKEI